ncbi:hypothetical protein HA402_011110 [Bradysia odoriphaga]|nr:hypothetical protein HA402_011110 [Bradysia odoriphaga]
MASTSSEDSLSGLIKFLEIVGNLKHIKRAGWVLRNVPDCETVAGHMYRMSIMTFLLDGREGLDRTKCLEMALVHDLAESLVGDITPYCGISKEDKKKKELEAMQEIANLIEPRGKHLMELFLEYEENQTAESKFVKDLDRLDMVLQAFEYEKRDECPKKHQEFFDSTEGKFNHPLVIGLVEQIKAQRDALGDAEKQLSTS